MTKTHKTQHVAAVALGFAALLNACTPGASARSPVRPGDGREHGAPVKAGVERESLTRDLATLDETISASRNPDYDFSYPVFLELVARVDAHASQELRTRREALKRQILASPASASGLTRILTAICGQLKDGDSVVSTLQALSADQKSMAVRTVIVHHALGDLYERQLYSEIVRNRDVIREMVRGQLDRASPSHRELAGETAAALYEAFLAEHYLSEARDTSAWILSVKPYKNTYDRLIAAAERASATEEMKRLEAEMQRVNPGEAPLQ